MKLIGITGTNGKTTTAYLVKQLLERCLDVKVGIIGTVDIMIGGEVIRKDYPCLTTPPAHSIRRMLRQMEDAGCSFCVMEVTSYSLAMHRSTGLHYDTGVFTNLGRDHLDYHRTMENYARAKAELFTMCDRAVGNADDPWFPIVMANAPLVYTISLHGGANLHVENIAYSLDGVSFDVVEGADREHTSVKMPGEFSVYNALTAIACLRLQGCSLPEACAALPLCEGPRGRMEKVADGIYIDYAVTPESLELALKTLRPYAANRIVLVFGCGGDRDKGKRPIMGRVASELADFVIVTSDNPRMEDPDAIIADIVSGMVGASHTIVQNRREAIRFAIETRHPGDLILLCGKGHEQYQIVGREKIPMDEREIVKEVLK